MLLVEIPDYVQADLDDNETVVWFDRPNPAPLLKLVIPALIVILASSILTYPADPFPLYGSRGAWGRGLLPYVAIMLLWERYSWWVEMQETYYVLTQRNLYLIRIGKKKRVLRFSLEVTVPVKRYSLFGTINLRFNTVGYHLDKWKEKRPVGFFLWGLAPESVDDMGLDLPQFGETRY